MDTSRRLSTTSEEPVRTSGHVTKVLEKCLRRPPVSRSKGHYQAEGPHKCPPAAEALTLKVTFETVREVSLCPPVVVDRYA